jgi:hypothetical protein
MAIVGTELFVITACEISIALGEAPISVVQDTCAYWYDDQCFALTENANAGYPFDVAVNLAGEIPNDRRKALGDYVRDTITLTVIGGDETKDPLTRLLRSAG